MNILSADVSLWFGRDLLGMLDNIFGAGQVLPGTGVSGFLAQHLCKVSFAQPNLNAILLSIWATSTVHFSSRTPIF